MSDEKGMSQSELSRRSGVSYVTINRMCNNLTEGVSLRTLDALARELGVEPGDLIEREEEPPPKRGRGGK
jgi:DNA-binding Xre family transcriptional regulator